MQRLLQKILLPSRLDLRVRNRREILRYLAANRGNGKIFGLLRKGSSQMYFVSVSFLEQEEGRDYVVLHWFETSGSFISNIKIYLKDIEAVCPLGNVPRAVSMIRSFFKEQIDMLIPQAA